MAAVPESSDLLVILDFDRTIFDTHRYYVDFLAMVEEVYGADFAAKLHSAQASSQYFDPFAYFLTQGVDYESVKAKLLAYHHRQYADNPDAASYIFPDALELVATLQGRPATTVGIITTGTPQSQEFKLSQCPELKDVPREIISGNKGLRVRRDLDAHGAVAFDGAAYARFVLIDDREDVLDQIAPHPDHTLIHIVRPGSKYQPTDNRPDIIQIPTLADVASNLQ